MQKALSIVVFAMSVTGCATSTQDYTPPAKQAFENSRHINKPFEVVWNNLVRQASSDFFVINNIDKDSRLMNLSFSSSKPSEYVDCGRSRRTFDNARGKQTFEYEAADSARFIITNPQHHAFHANRKTEVSGRVNIYIAPEGDGTLVSVNGKYVLPVTVSYAAFAGGAPAGQDKFEFNFSTKQPYSADGITCYSKGVIERRLLDMAVN